MPLLQSDDACRCDLSGGLFAAVNLDVSRQTLNVIEVGRYDPSLPLVFKIAQLFLLPIEMIFDGEDG